MGEIRVVMAAALPQIHKSAFSPADYRAAAVRLQAQVDGITANCKLPEEADQRLHIVLERIREGIADIKAASEPVYAAVEVVKALNLYDNHFEHAGWQPIVD